MPERDPFLSQAKKPAKGLVAVAALLGLLSGAAQAEPRLLWTAPLLQLKDMALAPARLQVRDRLWVGVGLAAFGALIQQDRQLREQWRGRQGCLDAGMPVLSTVGEGWALALGAAGAWGLGAAFDSPKLSEAGAVSLQALAVSGLLTAGLKQAVGSVRPSAKDDEHRFFDYQRPYGELSFPSGHSFSAFAFAEVMGEAYGRWWTYPLAGAIAYSRVYVGAHWPSDVFAGALLGILTGRSAWQSSRRDGPPTLLWGSLPEKNVHNIALSVRF